MTIKIHSSRISEFPLPSLLLSTLPCYLMHAALLSASFRVGYLQITPGRMSPMLAGRATGCALQAVCKTLSNRNTLHSQLAALIVAYLPTVCGATPPSPPLPACHPALTPPPSAAAVVVCNLMSFSLRPNRRCLCEPLFCCNHVASQRVVQHRAAQRAPCCCYCFASFCRCRWFVTELQLKSLCGNRTSVWAQLVVWKGPKSKLFELWIG